MNLRPIRTKGKPGEKPGDKPGDKPRGRSKEKPGEAPKDGKRENEGDRLDKAAERAAEEQEDEPDAPGRPNFKLVKTQLEPRDGFANYYFNRLERQQVWSRIQSLGDFKSLEDNWQWTGKLANENTDMELMVNPTQGRLKIGRRVFESELGDDMASIVDKNQEDALLVALRAWQQLLQVGPEQLGASIYLGTAPIYPKLDAAMSDMRICDVLQSDWVDCSVRFYVPVGSTEISCIEVTGDALNDPVEVYLDDYKEIDGRRWPGRARLQYGTEPRFLLALEKVAISSSKQQGEAISAQNNKAQDNNAQGNVKEQSK